ncbi:MAG TPA: hypothetical protein VEX43_05140 [Chthoniobacterales bacterium]|nr:hypothetical protein [Chthoniobacterales bacterium]
MPEDDTPKSLDVNGTVARIGEYVIEEGLEYTGAFLQIDPRLHV